MSPQNPPRQPLQVKHYAKSFLTLMSNSSGGLISPVRSLKPQEEGKS